MQICIAIGGVSALSSYIKISNNAMGQVVAEVQLQQQYEVRIGHRISTPEVYFYRFSGADGVATGSFVKE